MQKAINVRTDVYGGIDSSSLSDLNDYLSDGWCVRMMQSVQVTVASGSSGTAYRSSGEILVILEK